MQLTKEQEAIIATNDNLCINASAGSGKTSTLYHYIKTRPENSRVLYIAFNKSVQSEAEKKFADIDHLFLHIRTTHSMAFENIVRKYKYNVGFLNPEDVASILKISDFVMCVHIMKLVNYWCGCSEAKVENVDYKSTISTQLALDYVLENYPAILLGARKILGKMDKGEIPCIHDFYLKKWQLSNPVLKYDYILFDEGQDASETMLDIFLKQKSVKVIVGDSHQQIYSWRNAINSLDKVNFKKLELSKSFRFNQYIADMAVKSIKWKCDILNDKSFNNFNIIGGGISRELSTKAVIGRTNVGLLIEAITQVVIGKTCKKPYFEGGFANYSMANITFVARDIIKIINGKSDKVKTAKLKNINNKEGLLKFIAETEDPALNQAYDMVVKFNDNLIPYIKILKESIVENKEDADLIFTTVHKSKGMEYDDVKLLDDFNNKSKLEKMLKKVSPNFYENALKKANEEINLVYVGLTRTKNELNVPLTIFKEVAKDKK